MRVINSTQRNNFLVTNKFLLLLTFTLSIFLQMPPGSFIAQNCLKIFKIHFKTPRAASIKLRREKSCATPPLTLNLAVQVDTTLYDQHGRVLRSLNSLCSLRSPLLLRISYSTIFSFLLASWKIHWTFVWEKFELCDLRSQTHINFSVKPVSGNS